MNISFSEILVVFVVALLLFGPEQLPQIARGFGKIAGELRKASNAVRREWYNAVYPPAEEIRRDMAAHSAELRALRAQVLAPPEGSIGSPSKRHQSTDEASSNTTTRAEPNSTDGSKEQS